LEALIFFLRKTERPVCDQRSWRLPGKLVRRLAAVNRSLSILAIRRAPHARDAFAIANNFHRQRVEFWESSQQAGASKKVTLGKSTTKGATTPSMFAILQSLITRIATGTIYVAVDRSIYQPDTLWQRAKDDEQASSGCKRLGSRTYLTSHQEQDQQSLQFQATACPCSNCNFFTSAGVTLPYFSLRRLISLRAYAKPPSAYVRWSKEPDKEASSCRCRFPKEMCVMTNLESCLRASATSINRFHLLIVAACLTDILMAYPPCCSGTDDGNSGASVRRE